MKRYQIFIAEKCGPLLPDADFGGFVIFQKVENGEDICRVFFYFGKLSEAQGILNIHRVKIILFGQIFGDVLGRVGNINPGQIAKGNGFDV
jgi:hypothetical protein